MPDLYVQKHWYQYLATNSLITRRAGCTWISLANGIACITGGRYRPSPDRLHALVLPREETSPATPGWSIPDARLAASRFGGVTVEDRSGQGWTAVLSALDNGKYVLLQGDSDQFGNGTCSGTFDGDHCIGVHPKRRIINNIAQRWIDDPVCPNGRWESEGVLQAYAKKLDPSIRFGVFTQGVPALEWRWRAPRLVYVEYTGVDTVDHTYDGRHRERSSAWRSQPYHVSSPEIYRGAHGPQKLVKVGNLVKGGSGKYTGQWVLAENARQVAV